MFAVTCDEVTSRIRELDKIGVRLNGLPSVACFPVGREHTLTEPRRAISGAG